MPPQKTTKVLVKRRKFVEVDIPMIKSKIELIGSVPSDVVNRTMKLDLTRQLKGKSVEAIIKIKLVDNKAEAHPIKIKLMPYFIRRMIRKRISYIEDSFKTKSQESLIEIKPFLITRKRVSRAIRKTLRNKTKNWLEDYIMERKDHEIFSDILTNRLQKSLSLVLKKTYPLSLCEIRVLEIKRQLLPEEIPKIEKKKEEEPTSDVVDQLKELEDEKIKQAESEIKEAQLKAIEKESEDEKILKADSEEKPKKRSSKKKKEEA